MYPSWNELPDELVLSHSSLTIECKRKLEFRKFYTHGARSDSYSGDAGKAIHEGWQAFLKTGSEDEAAKALILAYPVHYKEFWGHNDFRSLEACYGTMMTLIHSQHLMEYRIAEVDCLDGIRRPAYEVEFEIILEGVTVLGKPVVYQGFIDAILFNALTGEYTVADLKTHRDYSQDLSGKFAYHAQCLPYGLVLDVIQNAQVVGFNVKYIAAFVDLLEPKIQVYPFPKSRQDVGDWFTGYCFEVRQIKQFAEAGWFPRKKDGCVAWKRTCMYLDQCASRDKESIQKYMCSSVQSPYVPKPRNPWLSIRVPAPEGFF